MPLTQQEVESLGPLTPTQKETTLTSEYSRSETCIKSVSNGPKEKGLPLTCSGNVEDRYTWHDMFIRTKELEGKSRGYAALSDSSIKIKLLFHKPIVH